MQTNLYPSVIRKGHGVCEIHHPPHTLLTSGTSHMMDHRLNSPLKPVKQIRAERRERSLCSTSEVTEKQLRAKKKEHVRRDGN